MRIVLIIMMMSLYACIVFGVEDDREMEKIKEKLAKELDDATKQRNEKMKRLLLAPANYEVHSDLIENKDALNKLKKISNAILKRHKEKCPCWYDLDIVKNIVELNKKYPNTHASLIGKLLILGVFSDEYQQGDSYIEPDLKKMYLEKMFELSKKISIEHPNSWEYIFAESGIIFYYFMHKNYDEVKKIIKNKLNYEKLKYNFLLYNKIKNSPYYIYFCSNSHRRSKNFSTLFLENIIESPILYDNDSEILNKAKEMLQKIKALKKSYDNSEK